MFWNQLTGALTAAVLLPIGLLASLLFVRVVIALTSLAFPRGSLPVVVHPLTFEHSVREFVDGQPAGLLELPSRLRDYLINDPNSLVTLAPGPVSPITPQVTAAAPDAALSANPWIVHLSNLFQSKYRPAYNVVLIPEMNRDSAAYPNGVAVGLQIVRSPGNVLVAAKSVQATDMAELVYKVGGSCAESILAQPAMLRNAPRWEQWRPNAYLLLRIGLFFQRQGDLERAHRKYTEAARRCPGNAQIALYHGNCHEKRGEYDKAAEVYDAAVCLWGKNIDLSYRLAAARTNHAMTSADLDQSARIRLVQDSNQILVNAQINLRRRAIAWSWLKCLDPRRRDSGERRYWSSWLQSDARVRPIRLLRKNKRHEYMCALTVAIESNELYLLALRKGEVKDDIADLVRASLAAVLEVTEKKRSGWLAHWTAACYFSRAAQLPEDWYLDESEWIEDWTAIRSRLATRGLGLDDEGKPRNWKTYCEERAIGEIGRCCKESCQSFGCQAPSRGPRYETPSAGFPGTGSRRPCRHRRRTAGRRSRSSPSASGTD